MKSYIQRGVISALIVSFIANPFIATASVINISSQSSPEIWQKSTDHSITSQFRGNSQFQGNRALVYLVPVNQPRAELVHSSSTITSAVETFLKIVTATSTATSTGAGVVATTSTIIHLSDDVAKLTKFVEPLFASSTEVGYFLGVLPMDGFVVGNSPSGTRWAQLMNGSIANDPILSGMFAYIPNGSYYIELVQIEKCSAQISPDNRALLPLNAPCVQANIDPLSLILDMSMKTKSFSEGSFYQGSFDPNYRAWPVLVPSSAYFINLSTTNAFGKIDPQVQRFVVTKAKSASPIMITPAPEPQIIISYPLGGSVVRQGDDTKVSWATNFMKAYERPSNTGLAKYHGYRVVPMYGVAPTIHQQGEFLDEYSIQAVKIGVGFIPVIGQVLSVIITVFQWAGFFDAKEPDAIRIVIDAIAHTTSTQSTTGILGATYRIGIGYLEQAKVPVSFKNLPAGQYVLRVSTSVNYGSLVSGTSSPFTVVASPVVTSVSVASSTRGDLVATVTGTGFATTTNTVIISGVYRKVATSTKITGLLSSDRTHIVFPTSQLLPTFIVGVQIVNENGTSTMFNASIPNNPRAIADIVSVVGPLLPIRATTSVAVVNQASTTQASTENTTSRDVITGAFSDKSTIRISAGTVIPPHQVSDPTAITLRNEVVESAVPTPQPVTTQVIPSPGVTITTPTDSENPVWLAGQSYPITWTSNEVPSATGFIIKLKSQSPSANDIPIAFGTIGQGSVQARVPFLIRSGNYQVEITARTVGGVVVTDISGGVITVRGSAFQSSNASDSIMGGFWNWISSLF